MVDNILDFWEDHRKLCIVLGVVLALVIVMFIIRGVNLNRKAEEERRLAQEQANVAASSQTAPVENDTPKDEYQNRLGLDADKFRDERVPVDTTPPDEETPVVPVQRSPRYAVSVSVFDNTSVPVRNQDGSSCKAYFEKVKLADFGTYWGSDLTEEDFIGHTRYYVGVKEENYNPTTNLESSGWLITHLGELEQNDVIQFTNLHVIGSLSQTHVALLCSYDWYSAYGMDDTLIMFEDISGTLETSDFSEGDIFSATVFVHNIKVLESVAGQRVIVCEYATYDNLMDAE